MLDSIMMISYRSHAAIQARAKRELEQERLALENQNENENTTSIDKAESSNQAAPETYLLAVTDVYYQCPLVSEEVLDKETWYERIQEFFSTQLSDDEAGLSACLVIHSCNDNLERVNYCVETLCKYLSNIIDNPSETKYWKIRMSNKVFQVYYFYCIIIIYCA